MKAVAAVLMPRCQCPVCQKHLDAATPVDGDVAVPEQGDLSLCINCGTMLEFTANLTLQVLPDATFNGLPMSVQFNLRKAADIIKNRTKKLDFDH